MHYVISSKYMNECAVNILMKPAVQRTILCVDHQNNLLWTMDIQLCVIKNIAKGSPAASLLNRPLSSIYYFRRHQLNTILSNSYPASLNISKIYCQVGTRRISSIFEYLNIFNIFNIWMSSIFQYLIICNIPIFEYLQYSPRWGARGMLQLLSLLLWVFKILSNIQFRDRDIFYLYLFLTTTLGDPEGRKGINLFKILGPVPPYGRRT